MIREVEEEKVIQKKILTHYSKKFNRFVIVKTRTVYSVIQTEYLLNYLLLAYRNILIFTFISVIFGFWCGVK
jgi:uncharacterized membrane protein